MVNEKEKEVGQRWLNLTAKRGQTQVIVPFKFQIESLLGMDGFMSTLYVNVSRRFVAIGKVGAKYFVPSTSLQNEGEAAKQNKWGKFKEVDKIMAFLCYDQTIHLNENGSHKDYTVCYEDRFLGLIETEVWRFHQEMECPYHRVRLLKEGGKVIWDRKNKFSSI